LLRAEKLYRFDPKTTGHDPAAREALVSLLGPGA